MQSRTQRWLALKEKASLLHMNHKTCGKAEATQVGSKCLTTWLFFWDRCETSLSCCERCLAPRICNGMVPSTAVALDLGRVGTGSPDFHLRSPQHCSGSYWFLEGYRSVAWRAQFTPRTDLGLYYPQSLGQSPCPPPTWLHPWGKVPPTLFL